MTRLYEKTQPSSNPSNSKEMVALIESINNCEKLVRRIHPELYDGTAGVCHLRIMILDLLSLYRDLATRVKEVHYG
jgi:hypothetical protein